MVKWQRQQLIRRLSSFSKFNTSRGSYLDPELSIIVKIFGCISWPSPFHISPTLSNASSAQLWSTFVFCSTGSASGFVYLRVAEPQWVLNISWLNWVSGPGFRKAKVTPKKREKQKLPPLTSRVRGFFSERRFFIIQTIKKFNSHFSYLVHLSNMLGFRYEILVLSFILLSRLSFFAATCHIIMNMAWLYMSVLPLMGAKSSLFFKIN